MASHQVKIPEALWNALSIIARADLLPPENVALHALSVFVRERNRLAREAQEAAEEEAAEEAEIAREEAAKQVAKEIRAAEEAADPDDADLARSLNISGYKGVYPNGDKWKVLYRGLLLGASFNTAIAAARARRDAHEEWLATKGQEAADAKADAKAEAAEEKRQKHEELLALLNTPPANPPPKVDFTMPFRGTRGLKPGERWPPKAEVAPPVIEVTEPDPDPEN